MHALISRRRLAAGILLAALLACWPSTASARVVRYRGHTIHVPRGWPVFDLASQPAVCVRFNRHAVYLGSPSARQRCPAYSIGRTEAILLGPSGRVTATWNHHPSVVTSALGVRALPASAPPASRRPVVRAARASAAGAVYTGPGFDVCSAPSTAEMSAWSSSRYHAIGVYVGGTNSACSQPNLTASWVSREQAAGWHLIPTYVGLQAPGACGCATIDSTRPGAQGKAAANDAIARAGAIGIGAGNPIYFDMEAYPRGGTTTASVLKFLSAWTNQLHAAGYLSGVYSSGASGIQDLAAKYGTGYTEPDDLWIADWNGKQSVSDPYVPAADWSAHQRLHQYSGGHSETHRGVTLDIDGDYLDGSTAGIGLTPSPTPRLAVKPVVDGSVQLRASWSGAAGIASWQVLAGSSAGALSVLGTPFAGGAASMITVHSQFPYYAVQALDAAGHPLGTTPARAIRSHLAIYGRSAFVPTHGLAGIPIGCFTGSTCHIATTLTAGKTVVATGGRQFVRANGGGIVFVKLTPAGRAMLASPSKRHVAVEVRAADSSGVRAKTALKLVPFFTRGKAPPRSLSPSPTLRLMGATDFVYRSAVGGILAACPGSIPCLVNTTITVGNTTIASAGPQFIGANELGYLPFRLTPQGRTMLAHKRGNQLGASVTLDDGTASAGGQIVLVGFK